MTDPITDTAPLPEGGSPGVTAPTIVSAAANPTVVPPAVVVDSTAVRGILLSLATGALRVVGTALVAHGVMTQGMADSVIPVAAQEIVGTAILLIGQFWAWLREQAAHNRTMAAALADPKTIVVK